MNILAIGAHADDIEVSCGGTLATHVANGDAVHMLVLAHSGYTDYRGVVCRTKERAAAEAQAAGRILGVCALELLNFETKDLPYNSATVEAINARIDALAPDVIFTHWHSDTHQDHRNTALSTLAAARYHNCILMYEPMMPAGRSYAAFRPQAFCNITAQIDVKLAALKAHESQCDKYSDAWLSAITARSRLRGFECSVDYAEAFEVVRLRWPG